MLSFIPTPGNLGRMILGLYFLSSGLQSGYNYQRFRSVIGSTGLPYTTLMTILAILIKIIGGLALLIGFPLSKYLLIAFTLIASVLKHNPLVDPTQTTMLGKNIAIVGGLLAA